MVNEVDPEISNDPIYSFFSYFGNAEIDLKFDSTNQLPEILQKHFFRTNLPFKGMPSFLNSFLSSVESNFDIYFTIQDLAAVKISVNGPQFSQIAKDLEANFKNKTF